MSHTSSFKNITKKEYFIDKTLLIKAVMETGEYILITARRRFGKSINLDMLRCFFSGSCSRDIFAKLKIGTFSEIMSEHRQYPVIFINFYWYSGAMNSYKDVVMAFHHIMHRTFKQYQCLTDSDKLEDYEK